MEQQLLNNKYRILNGRCRKQGSYGAVFKVINEEGQIFAVKEIKQTYGMEGMTQEVIRQKINLNCLIDNNIIKLEQDFMQNRKAYLVFPYYQMNLREFMKNHFNNNVPNPIIKKIMSQLLSALYAAHSKRIIHRDVKPENIMVDIRNQDPQNFQIKLADWGASKKLNTGINDNLTVEVIPIAYRPPELFFSSKRYSETVDIWSVGCIFYELLMGKRPFDSHKPNQVLLQMMNIVGLSQNEDEKWIMEMYQKIGLDCSEEDLKEFRTTSLDSAFQAKFGYIPPACNLVKQMLRIHPDRRISAIDSKKHNYFNINN